MKEEGPEVIGSPASHPPTVGPQRRPASVARRISTGARQSFSTVVVATDPTVSQLRTPAHHLA